MAKRGVFRGRDAREYHPDQAAFRADTSRSFVPLAKTLAFCRTEAECTFALQPHSDEITSVWEVADEVPNAAFCTEAEIAD